MFFELERQALPRLFCAFCGGEIPPRAVYWYINGAAVCDQCLPEFARRDYLPCRSIRGEEGFHDLA